MLLYSRQDCFDEDTRLRKCAEGFRRHLERLNEAIYNEVQQYLSNAVDNCMAGMFKWSQVNDRTIGFICHAWKMLFI